MRQWYEQPEDDAPMFGEPCRRVLWKRLLAWAVLYAALVGAVLLVAALAGCASAPSGPWRATLEIRYANGQRITAAGAGENERVK